MKKIIGLYILFLLSNYTWAQEGIESYLKSTGISMISHEDLEIIYKKVPFKNLEIEKIIITEVSGDIGDFLLSFSVYAKKKNIEYYFYQANTESKIKYDGKEKITEIEECIGEHIDGYAEKKMYILPFSNGVFNRDSAKHYICQSAWMKFQERLPDSTLYYFSNLIGEWGIYSTNSTDTINNETVVSRTQCNQCPTITFHIYYTGTITIPSGEKTDIKWTIQNKKLLISNIDSSKANNIFSNSEYTMSFTQENNIIELELIEKNNKHSIILRHTK